MANGYGVKGRSYTQKSVEKRAKQLMQRGDTKAAKQYKKVWSPVVSGGKTYIGGSSVSSSPAPKPAETVKTIEKEKELSAGKPDLGKVTKPEPEKAIKTKIEYVKYGVGDKTGEKIKQLPNLQEMQEKEAERLIKKGLKSSPGGHHISGNYPVTVGSSWVYTTEKEHHEIVKIGSETYETIQKAPEGQKFVTQPRRRVPLTVKVFVPEDQATKARAEAITGSMLPQLTPLQGAAVEARTLLSERGHEYVGAVILGDTKGRQKVVEEKLIQDATAVQLGETPVESYGRGIIEGFQSPVVEVEMAFLGGAGAAKAAGTSIGAKVIGSTAGKAALLGVGGASLGVRGMEIKTAYDEGNINKAVGMAATTIADIGAGMAGYKMSQPKPSVTKLKGITQKEVKIKGKYSKLTKGDTDASILTVKQKPVSGTTSVAKLKADPSITLHTKKVPIKVSKMKVGGWTRQVKWEPIGKTGLSRKVIDMKEPALRWVAREVKTGKIAAVGKKVDLRTSLGIKSRFYSPDTKLIKLEGVSRTLQYGTMSSTDKGTAGAMYSRKFSVLVPKKVVTPVRQPDAPLIGRSMKGSAQLLTVTKQKMGTATVQPVKFLSPSVSKSVTISSLKDSQMSSFPILQPSISMQGAVFAPISVAVPSVALGSSLGILSRSALGQKSGLGQKTGQELSSKATTIQKISPTLKPISSDIQIPVIDSTVSQSSTQSSAQLQGYATSTKQSSSQTTTGATVQLPFTPPPSINQNIPVVPFGIPTNDDFFRKKRKKDSILTGIRIKQNPVPDIDKIFKKVL